MSIHVHKTGLNKTLGQQSDAIVTTGLTGNFIPTAGIETLYWDNQVSSGLNLRRFNGIAHSTTDPDHFLLDGTNDYLGKAATSYGGNPFTLNPSNAFTIAQWVKYNNVNHILFYMSVDGAVSESITPSVYSRVILEILTSNDQCKLTVVSTAGGPPPEETSANTTFSNFTFSDDKWYYIALTYNGSDEYKLYVNGSFVGSNAVREANNENQIVEIGAKNIVNTKSYSGAGTKVGHVHVYTAELTNSQLRQNFLASHSVNNARIYGATYTA